MSRRHRDALAISDGACNPGAIARSLVAACNELHAEGAGTDAVCADPAVRLMVYQLAWITRSLDHHFPPDEYGQALDACRE